MTITRAAAKRNASDANMGVDEGRSSKKRVVLAEISNISNLNRKRITQEPKKSLRAPSKQIKTAPVVVVESDIDSRSDDPQMCGPCVGDIYNYLRELEVKPKQRPLLGSETLFLTVSHIDRFLSLKSVNKQRLQLVGVSAMLIASKYEEISPPKIEDFCYITENTFTKQDVVKMETDILLALQFELGRPTIIPFLRRFIQVAEEDSTHSQQLEPLCCYLSELSILDYKTVKFVPSLLAASAVFLARFIIRHDLYLGRRGSALQAVREKYKHHKYRCVATMPASPEIPATFWEDVTV